MHIRSVLLASLLVVCFAQLSYAQSDDYNAFEGSISFSHNRVDTGVPDADFDDDPGFDDDDLDDIFDQREGFNGFNLSVTGNFTQYLGAKFDFSGHYNDRDIDIVGFPRAELRESLYNVLGGVQIKDNTTDDDAVFKPFGHVLAGIATARTEIEVVEDFGFDDDFSETGFAGVVGGGLDIRVHDRVDIRAIQLDYNPTRLFDRWQHNFRIGVGIVFH